MYNLNGLFLFGTHNFNIVVFLLYSWYYFTQKKLESDFQDKTLQYGLKLNFIGLRILEPCDGVSISDITN